MKTETTTPTPDPAQQYAEAQGAQVAHTAWKEGLQGTGRQANGQEDHRRDAARNLGVDRIERGHVFPPAGTIARFGRGATPPRRRGSR